MNKSFRICILSRQRDYPRHVSEDSIKAFEHALISDDHFICKYIYKYQLIISKRFPIINNFVINHWVKKINNINPDYVFIIAMNPAVLYEEKEILKGIKSKIIVYCIDTWGSRINTWAEVINYIGVEFIFCSNLKSVDIFNNFCKRAFFLPYSMNTKYFHPRSFNKSRLFIQLGRKNRTLHEYTIKYLEEKKLPKYEYAYQKDRKIMYKNFIKLAEEINKTLFFLVSPRDVDEPDYTGGISDVTARFYEGMACKSLLVGYKPKDSYDLLFPKDSMITVESYDDFKKTIDYYITHLDEYNEKVSRNYEFLMANHTWKRRKDYLLQTLDQYNDDEI